jgi:predicted GNAT family acetyltransferase
MVEPTIDSCALSQAHAAEAGPRARLDAVAENIAVRDNPSELRYELLLDERVVGEIRYRLATDAVVLVHTEVLPWLEGGGFGARLVAGALDDIRERGLHVVPICPFVRSYIRRHADYRDLVVRDVQVGD